MGLQVLQHYQPMLVKEIHPDYMKQETLEYKARTDDESQDIAVNDALSFITQALA